MPKNKYKVDLILRYKVNLCSNHKVPHRTFVPVVKDFTNRTFVRNARSAPTPVHRTFVHGVFVHGKFVFTGNLRLGRRGLRPLRGRKFHLCSRGISVHGNLVTSTLFGDFLSFLSEKSVEYDHFFTVSSRFSSFIHHPDGTQSGG